MEFRGTDTMVYDTLIRIMDEFGLSPDDLEAYQKEERSCVSLAELKRRLEMAPDKQRIQEEFINKWCRMYEPIKPEDWRWRGFRPMCQLMKDE